MVKVKVGSILRINETEKVAVVEVLEVSWNRLHGYAWNAAFVIVEGDDGVFYGISSEGDHIFAGSHPKLIAWNGESIGEVVHGYQ